MEEEGDEAVSRLTLQDIQGGLDGGDDENFDMEMGHNDSSDAATVAPAVGACTSFSPFASPAMQVRIFSVSNALHCRMFPLQCISVGCRWLQG